MTRENFLQCVFQLADQWTSTVDLDEYVDFLDDGYANISAVDLGSEPIV